MGGIWRERPARAAFQGQEKSGMNDFLRLVAIENPRALQDSSPN
jgi:hypothetical protein